MYFKHQYVSIHIYTIFTTFNIFQVNCKLCFYERCKQGLKWYNPNNQCAMTSGLTERCKKLELGLLASRQVNSSARKIVIFFSKSLYCRSETVRPVEQSGPAFLSGETGRPRGIQGRCQTQREVAACRMEEIDLCR